MCFLAFWLPLGTYAAESIPSFDARITVNSNATIEVTERIVYDFGPDAVDRHGIFRTIPFSYQAGSETYIADISSVIVTNGYGQPVPFTESRGNGELTVKIGDPNKTVQGTQTYVLSYQVEGPFLYFDDYDEFYWNVTGSWNKNSIEHANVLVDLPRGTNVLRAACYQGPPRSGAACTRDEKLINTERAGYHAEAVGLAPGESFTVAVAFPKGAIAVVESALRGRTRGQIDYAPFTLPALVLIGMLWLWYVRGRDPRGRGTIVAQFEPPEGVSPAVAGTVYNEKIEQREVSAEIVRLAVEGYVRIHRLEEKVLLLFPVTDYLLERLNPQKSPADPVGVLILDKLFQQTFMATKEIDGRDIAGVLLSSMEHKFTDEYKVIEERLYDEVVVQGYFPASPRAVRTAWVIGGITILVVGVFSIVTSLGAPLVLSGAIIALIGWFMPVKTRSGVALREHLEGFKRYLSVAEKDRLAFHNPPENIPELFDRYLPYAIAFGVEEKWAKQFEGIYRDQPNWYSGGHPGTFAVASLASDLSSFTSTVAAASAPQTSGGSGGGGFSGGGFGGGGGGSW